MRTSSVLAAAAAGFLSLGLLASTADAAQATHGRSLVGTATCDQGQARLATTVDAAGTERGTVTLTGLGSRRWRGGLQLNPAAVLAKVDNGDNKLDGAELKAMMGPKKVYLAKHGRISASAKMRGSRSLDAAASFTGPSMDICSITLMADRGQYAVSGVMDSLAVRTGYAPAVQLAAMGEAHHRYLVTATVRTKAGVQHRTFIRRTGTVGVLEVTIRDFKGLAGFTEITASAKDLTVTDLPAETFSIAR